MNNLPKNESRLFRHRGLLYLFFAISILFILSCSTKLPHAVPGFSFAVTAKNTTFKTGDIPLKLKFINNTKEQVRLLNKFEPAYIFLSVKFTGLNSTEIYYPMPGGKADFSYLEKMEYKPIPAGKFFEKEINLGHILKEYKVIIPPGSYKMEMTYHNQYGQDCVQGVLKSNELIVQIIP